jgi:hypothetical protein
VRQVFTGFPWPVFLAFLANGRRQVLLQWVIRGPFTPVPAANTQANS